MLRIMIVDQDPARSAVLEQALTDAGQIVFEYARRFDNLQSDLENALAELREGWGAFLDLFRGRPPGTGLTRALPYLVAG